MKNIIKRGLLIKTLILVILIAQLFPCPASAAFITGDLKNPLFDNIRKKEPDFKLENYTVTYVGERCEIWAVKGNISNSNIEQLAKRIDEGIKKIEDYVGTTFEEKFGYKGKIIYFLRPNVVSHAHYKPVVILSHFLDNTAPYLHESVHVIAGTNGVRWMSEGLAVYLNDKLGGYPTAANKGRDLYEISKEYLKSEYQRDLDLVGYSGKSTFDSDEERLDFYKFAGSFVRYLIEKIGIQDFMKVFNSNDTEKAILEITSKSMPEWKYEWLNFLGAPESMNPKPVPGTASTEASAADAILIHVGSPKAYVSNKPVQIDSDNVGVVPFVKDGRTLVPVRFIAENFGARVEWEEAAETVIVTIDEKIIKLQLGNSLMFVNNAKFTLDVPAERTDGRMFVPLRALVETALGKKISYKDGLIVISRNEIEITDTLLKAYPFE